MTNGVWVKHRSNGIVLIKMYNGWEQSALPKYRTTDAWRLPVKVNRTHQWLLTADLESSNYFTCIKFKVHNMKIIIECSKPYSALRDFYRPKEKKCSKFSKVEKVPSQWNIPKAGTNTEDGGSLIKQVWTQIQEKKTLNCNDVLCMNVFLGILLRFDVACVCGRVSDFRW